MTIYVNLFILSIVQYSTAVGSFLENFLSLSTSLDSYKKKKIWLRIRIYPLPSLRYLKTKT